MSGTTCFAITDHSAKEIIGDSDPFRMEQEAIFEPWIEFFLAETPHKPDCMVAGLEKTQAGTWHYQVALYYAKKKRISGPFKDALPDGVHIEVARGSWKQNKQYCMKGLQPHEEWEAKKASGPNYGKDAITIILGTEPARGQQTEYREIFEDMKEGILKLEDVIWQYPDLYSRYRGGFQALDSAIQKRTQNRFREVETVVLWGEAGVGKTRRAYEEAEAFAPGKILYPVTCGDGHNLWFDGYDGEECILIDDFYGQISFNFWLRLCDGHPLKIQKKGSFGYAAWRRIYITSNKCPCQWWPNLGERPWDKLEFRRRLTTIIPMGNVACDHSQPPKLSHDRD